jgi:hypothetical protein
MANAAPTQPTAAIFSAPLTAAHAMVLGAYSDQRVEFLPNGQAVHSWGESRGRRAQRRAEIASRLPGVLPASGNRSSGLPAGPRRALRPKQWWSREINPPPAVVVLSSSRVLT